MNPHGERWLVCGGRHFSDRNVIDIWLSNFVVKRGVPEVVIHGGATGADTLANDWAVRWHIPVIREPVNKVDWKRLGRSAGPVRNQRMLEKHKPTLVIAFPGGNGTADMTRRALDAGIAVIRIQD